MHTYLLISWSTKISDRISDINIPITYYTNFLEFLQFQGGIFMGKMIFSTFIIIQNDWDTERLIGKIPLLHLRPRWILTQNFFMVVRQWQGMKQGAGGDFIQTVLITSRCKARTTGFLPLIVVAINGSINPYRGCGLLVGRCKVLHTSNCLVLQTIRFWQFGWCTWGILMGKSAAARGLWDSLSWMGLEEWWLARWTIAVQWWWVEEIESVDSNYGLFFANLNMINMAF